MREFTCIICPNGCHLIVDDKGNVSGNTCKRGETFAKEEITCPKRTICSTVKTIFDEAKVVSVKTDKEIDKKLVLDVMKEINKVVLKEHLSIGDIVLKNILGTDVNIILTTNILKEI